MHHIADVEVEDPILTVLYAKDVPHIKFEILYLFEHINVWKLLIRESSFHELIFNSAILVITESQDESDSFGLVQFWDGFKPLHPCDHLSQHRLCLLNRRFQNTRSLFYIKCSTLRWINHWLLLQITFISHCFNVLNACRVVGFAQTAFQTKRMHSFKRVFIKWSLSDSNWSWVIPVRSLGPAYIILPVRPHSASLSRFPSATLGVHVIFWVPRSWPLRPSHRVIIILGLELCTTSTKLRLFFLNVESCELRIQQLLSL